MLLRGGLVKMDGALAPLAARLGHGTLMTRIGARHVLCNCASALLCQTLATAGLDDLLVLLCPDQCLGTVKARRQLFDVLERTSR